MSIKYFLLFSGNNFCSAKKMKQWSGIKLNLWPVNCYGSRLNLIKAKCHFRMFCIFCIFVVLTILPGSYTAPSPSPQVSAIPEKRKKWCMKIYLYIVLYILKYLMTYGSNIFHGLNLQMDPLIKLLLIRRKRWRKKWVSGCQVI